MSHAHHCDRLWQKSAGVLYTFLHQMILRQTGDYIQAYSMDVLFYRQKSYYNATTDILLKYCKFG